MLLLAKVAPLPRAENSSVARQEYWQEPRRLAGRGRGSEENPTAAEGAVRALPVLTAVGVPVVLLSVSSAAALLVAPAAEAASIVKMAPRREHGEWRQQEDSLW